MRSLKSQSYYEILGVGRGASSVEIHNAYEISKSTFQENSLATYSLYTDEENREILLQVGRAYETLFNPRMRREYDAFLDGLDEDEPGSAGPQLTLNSEFEDTHPNPTTGYPQGVGGRAAVPAQSTLPEHVHLGGALTPSRPLESPPPMPKPVKSRERKQAEEYAESVAVFNGAELRKIRKMQGLSVEDVAEQTKIRKAYIEYLEEHQYEFLPAEIYVRGFVGLIAGMLGLPAQRVAEDYMAQYRSGGTG